MSKDLKGLEGVTKGKIIIDSFRTTQKKNNKLENAMAMMAYMDYGSRNTPPSLPD